MSNRYNLRSTHKKNVTNKRKRPSDNFDDQNDTEDIQFAALKLYIRTIIKNSIEEDMDGVLETIDHHVSTAFDNKMHETTKRFAALTLDEIKKNILDSCHEMIHSHLDTLDITVNTDQFKQIISHVIATDFGGKLKKQKGTQTVPTKLIIKTRKTSQNTNDTDPVNTENTENTEKSNTNINPPPVNSEYPDDYDEETLKDHTDATINRIVALQTTDENKKVIYRQYRKKQDSKSKEWLEIALSMPYDETIDYPITSDNTNKKIHDFLLEMKTKLDNKVHGMQEAKEEIILEVMKRMTNIDCKGKIIVFEGPPGVGKTYLSRCVSECIGIPFDSIALGGCKDASTLNGHDYCYVGSHPGAIARSLKKLGCSNGLLYLDEIDKLGNTSKGQEVTSSFLSILDETQNSDFEDNYLFNLKLNLSKIFFVGSINNNKKVDPILLNRMKIIKIPTPTLQDKLETVKQYFIPNYLQQFNIPDHELLFSDNIIKYIMTKTTAEPGVRNIKRSIEHIISRFHILKKTNIRTTKKRKKNHDKLNFSFSIPHFKIPLTLNTQHIDTLMNKQTNDNNHSYKKLYL